MFMDVKSPQGFLDKIKMLPMLADMGKFFPKTVATGPCKEVIKQDKFLAARFSHPAMLAERRADASSRCPASSRRDPSTGKRNVGMYRMQVYDEHTTGMHWQRQKVGAEHYREACAVRRSRVARSPPGDGGEAAASARRRRHHGADFGRARLRRRRPAVRERWKSRSPSAPTPR